MSHSMPFQTPGWWASDSGTRHPVRAIEGSGRAGCNAEIAKWRYLEDQPGRKRSPRGFTDQTSLKLTGIEAGSAVSQIRVFFAPDPFPSLLDSLDSLPPASLRYVEQARGSLVVAINAAEHNESITEHLPDFLLDYFNRIGRGLQDSDRIDFYPTNLELSGFYASPRNK